VEGFLFSGNVARAGCAVVLQNLFDILMILFYAYSSEAAKLVREPNVDFANQVAPVLVFLRIHD
jgi:hypothetical protein